MSDKGTCPACASGYHDLCQPVLNDDSQCDCRYGGHREALAFPEWDGTFKPITVEMSFCDVDPEVLGLLTGGAMGTMPEPTFSIGVNTKIKRKWWQWLLRRPQEWQHTPIPHARLATPDED